MIAEALYTASGLAPAAFVHQLERLLRIRCRVIPPHRIVCLDTFDGRIAAGGGQLWQVGEGATARLEWRPRDRQLRVTTSLRTTVAFVWDLPRGTVATQLLAVMRANEAGLRKDLDTEFLHDYRVALRRTRSLLGQIREVFPAVGVEHFREEFRWLGAVTGPARDLDVLMLELRPVPDDPGGDIPAVRRHLAERQRRTHRAMLKHLDSPRCRRLFAGWTRFLAHTSPASPEPANAGRPLADVLSSRAWRLYRRLSERASLVTVQSPPTALHQIRIAAKKLRYVADLTRSIQERGAVDDVIAVLKKLQMVLGDYNDTVVHERLLLDEGRVLGTGHGAGRPRAGARGDSVGRRFRMPSRTRSTSLRLLHGFNGSDAPPQH